MTKTGKFAAALLCSAVLAACGQTQSGIDQGVGAQTATAQATQRKAGPGLSEAYAKQRKQQIAAVDYRLSVQIDKNGESFGGRVVAETELVEPVKAPLTIDFAGGSVKAVTVDGKSVPFEYNDHFITIAPEHLHGGKNAIAVDYRHPYSTDGSGLHRFEDPEDGRVYMYTDFEPYDANRLFPHFDQPNLKAHYTLDVKAPKDWLVISSVREEKIEQLENGFNHWYFPQSKKFSSYIFSLHAGPFHTWEDDADGIPLRLMARQSLAEYVKPQDWFTFTKQSFAFFQDYFEVDYPFVKYDQVIVPDFNAGAMENVGAVTFSERFVSRGEKTRAQRSRLANVIAHEMAHMWFGDLVTMDWWNGLWLNESFATYMANLALAEASEFDDAWENFYLGTKQWAYHSDQLVTTHAIELPVNNTAEAFANFDGITYGKGGSVLKQLPYYLGKEEFRKGVSNYLKELSYKNAELDDFIGHLGKAAGKDLGRWQQQWLYQPGLNTLTADFQCSDGKVTSLSLKQSAPMEYPTLREQRTQLGFYQMQDGAMVRTATLPVLYRGEVTEVTGAKDMECPQILYPNEGDWAFVKVNLDPVSVEQASQHINDIDSAFTRLMLWQSLYDSVYDAKLPLDQYVQFALDNAGPETDINVVRLVSGHLTTAYAYLNQVAIDDAKRTELQLAIESFIWQQLQQAKAGSDAQKTWFSAFTEAAHSDGALANAGKLLNGELAIEGLTLDPDMRWSLVVLQNQHLYGDYQKAIERELEKDSSDRARNFAISAEAVRPQPEAKAKWLDNVIDHRDDFKLSQLKAAAYTMFPSEQSELFQANLERIVGAIDAANATNSPEYIGTFKALFPLSCSEKGIEQVSKILDEKKDLNPLLEKGMKNRRFENQRCVAMSELLTGN
ncbi:aminopeptidase N [Microbulbifer rhizosphaerae]|uniref:Aminopeptidase N n=1 Tax=Microbulbifer rhizosphaerae TaxID=1562603 RepID=A0A7W4ZA26_9GAMM|nr:aminopeptidase N [Microbulbifer rhizosphaerae]MBB3062141.1 aminopeptidase N [Microbulbifer rhizosphaerae]